MASSWEYPSLNRMSDLQQSDRVGEFERLPPRINASNYNRSRFETRDTNSGGRSNYGGGRASGEGGHYKGVHGRGSHDFAQPSQELLSNLPLPRPGMYGSGVDRSSKSWDSVPSSKHGGAVGNRNGSSSSSSIDTVTLDDEFIKEELFPPNKVALLQENLDACPDLNFIGLEYIIEVQHNSAKNLAPIYHCLLCHEETKTCETTPASLELIKSHLQSVSHKSNYIEAYFPTLKKCILNKIDGGSKSSAFREAVAGICQKLTATYGKMNIKIVVGLNLFGRRQQEIKKMIDNSTHFRENREFLDLFIGGDQYLANSYEKAFSDFEAELRKKNSRDRHRSYDSYRDSNRSYRNRERYRHRRSRSRSPRYSDDRKSSSRNSYGGESSEYDRHKRERTEETTKKSAFVDILVNRKDHEVTQRRHSYSRQSSSYKERRMDFPSTENSSTPTRQLSKGLEKEIERYLVKDNILNEKLDQERKEYLNFPHTHRKYNEEWEKFYLDITTKRGITDSETINQEWIEHWKAFFFESFDLEVRKRKEELMADHQITNRDLDDYYHLKSKSLEEQVENKISNSRENNDSTSASSQEKKAEEEDDKEVTVISTFRLLFGLESILDELGPTVIRLMSKINSIEVNEGFGSSSNMINEDEVFTLLWKAKEKLDYKINNDIIDGSKLPASKVCVNNISCLIKKSKCEMPKDPPNPHLSNEISIRAGIAKTVVEQLNAQGKIITESQLASIVEMEYARVKDSVSATSSSATPNPQSKNTIELMDFKKEEIVTPKSEEDLEKMTCKQLADIFKRFREFNKITRCMILDYMKKIEKTNPARVTEMKKIIHSKA